MPRSSASVETKLSQRQAWLMASRPRTLPASVAPVIVGTALAIQAGAFEPAAALVALLCALLIQIGSNFANDLGDFRRGTDEQGRVGPTRVTTAGLLTPEQVKTGMFVVFRPGRARRPLPDHPGRLADPGGGRPVHRGSHRLYRRAAAVRLLRLG